jgi:hypothetical protein
MLVILHLLGNETALGARGARGDQLVLNITAKYFSNTL